MTKSGGRLSVQFFLKHCISLMLPYQMPDATSGVVDALITLQALSLGHLGIGRDMLEDKGFGHTQEGEL